ncbi:leishmanolysin-like peptidase [Silurus asotus]|uniref:Leishmanolysin-like peptidase n=1 Tax=Silurus asotus TaxID=30991 RepID=A0AAD5B458_SILAS|nr:leishmanolysin-like peptidase [Silurus asotus]
MSDKCAAVQRAEEEYQAGLKVGFPAAVKRWLQAAGDSVCHSGFSAFCSSTHTVTRVATKCPRLQRLDEDKSSLVKDKLFPQAIDYLQKAFRVRRQAGPVLLSRQCATNQYLRKKDEPHRYCQEACANITKCGPVIVPEQHLQQCRVCSDTWKLCGPHGPPDGDGIEGADFVLYVSGVTTERCGQENIVAYAAYCQLEAELDRPIAGYANLCPSMISTQPQEFEGMLSTVKHEIMHALGFSAGLFAFYHDDDGKPLTPRFASGLPAFNESLGLYQWSEKVIKSATRLWDIRGGHMIRHKVHLMVTPRVVNEAMTGSHTQNRVFSRITLAIMEDTGWYRANYSMAEDLEWGKGLGCDFVMKSCKFWIDQQRKMKPTVSPYCDSVRGMPLQLSCRQDLLAVAVCNLQKYPQTLPQEYQYFDRIAGVAEGDLPFYGGSVEIADFCPFSQEFSWHLSGEYQRSSFCRIQENQPDSWRNYAAEEYGPDSVCLYQKSAFVMEQCNKRMTYPDWGSGCYKTVLNERERCAFLRPMLQLFWLGGDIVAAPAQPHSTAGGLHAVCEELKSVSFDGVDEGGMWATFCLRPAAEILIFAGKAELTYLCTTVSLLRTRRPQLKSEGKSHGLRRLDIKCQSAVFKTRSHSRPGRRAAGDLQKCWC